MALPKTNDVSPLRAHLDDLLAFCEHGELPGTDFFGREQTPLSTASHATL